MNDDETQNIPTAGPADEHRTEDPMDVTTITDTTTSDTTTDTTPLPTSQQGQTAWAEPAPVRSDAPGIRVGTVVWGLVVAAIGIGLVALAGGVTFDVELAVILLLVAAGVALVVGSVVSGMRRRER